jgi:hypothetical protein
MIGLKAITLARGSGTGPLRFLYMSGTAAERDPTKTPRFMPAYSLMRVSAWSPAYLNAFRTASLTWRRAKLRINF